MDVRSAIDGDRNYLPLLTGLRGVAALIVFVSHAANAGLLPAVLGRGFGQVGVMVFFALSGFLMAHLYLGRSFRATTVKAYALARIARVFPLYFGVVLGSILVSSFLPSSAWFPFVFEDPLLIATSLSMLRSKYVLWSIPVEVQFYVVFIGLWAIVARGVRWPWVAAFLLSVSIPSTVLYGLSGSLPNVVSKYAHVFALGVLVAAVHDRLSADAVAVRLAGRFGLPALVLLLCNLPEIRRQSGMVLVKEVAFPWIWFDPVTLAIVGVLLFFAAMQSSSLVVLRHRVPLYFGRISYGFYLLHYPILRFFVEHPVPGPVGSLLLAFGCTVFAAHVSLTWFERPIGARIRRFS